VKGFAVTLTIGLITSVFTAVFVTRGLVNLFYGGNNTRTISIGWGLPRSGSSATPPPATA
jgi:preprotein translocase subunit SecD